MLGLKFEGNTKLRVSRWGTLCGVFAMLVFVTGCPITPVTPCTEDADCDDGLFCNGAETCVEEACVVGEAPCDADYCDEENGVCLECLTDADCDDAGLCTTDACVANACVYTAVDCGDQLCDPATGDCVDCVADADCDDELYCTGVETCVDGACVAGTDPCDPDTEVCDETAGACVEICETDADCDDGLYCNGAETCGDDGACVDGTSPCAVLCDEDADACVDCLTDADCEADEVCVDGACTPSCVACVADVDCDDTIDCTDDTCSDLCCANVDNCATGTFCDMVEGAGTCIGCLTNDDCTTATPICTSGGTCVECEADTDCTVGSCVDNVCITTIAFTIGQDNLFGTTGDDTFDGSLDVVVQSGAQVPTVQTGDSADGKDGVDTLNASFNAGGNVVPTLSNIEILNVSDYGTTVSVLKLGSTTGATAVNAVGSVITTEVEDISTALDLGITNTDQGFSATFKQAATSGTADSTTLTLDRVTDGTMTIVTNAASGFESLTLSSTGPDANTLGALATTGNAATLKTLYVTGDQAVKVKVVPTSLTTRIDASGMTVTSPGLTLGTGTSVAGSSAYAAFGTFNIGNLVGSPGDDLFIFAATLTDTDADGTTEFLDGGDGTDVLQASLATSLSTAAHIKNIEELRLNASTAVTLSLTSVTGLETFTIESDSATVAQTDTITLSNFPSIPALAYRGNGAETSQFFDPIIYTTLGGGGGSDSLAITLGNRGTALGTSGSSNAFTTGALTAANIETMTYTITDMPTSAATQTTLGGITATQMTTLTMTSNGDVTLGTIAGATATGTGLATANFSGVSGRIRATSSITNLAGGATVTLTANNDTLLSTGLGTAAGVTVNGGAGDDTLTAAGNGTFTLNGGAGEDNLTGSAQADTLNGGTGNDTLVASLGGDAMNGNAGNDIIGGGAGANTINGGDGNDAITGGTLVDTIDGGAGDDTITPGTGIDTVTTGDGADDVVSVAILAANADIITDFTPGTDDFDFNGALARGGTTTPACASATGVTFAAAITAAAAGDTVFIVAPVTAAADIFQAALVVYVASDKGVAAANTFEVAAGVAVGAPTNIGTAADFQLLVVNTTSATTASSSAVFYHNDVNADDVIDAGDLEIIAVFSGVNAATLTIADFP